MEEEEGSVVWNATDADIAARAAVYRICHVDRPLTAHAEVSTDGHRARVGHPLTLRIAFFRIELAKSQKLYYLQ